MARDFRNHSFQKILRGYSPEEVDEYLSYVNEEYAKVEQTALTTIRQLAMALKKLDEMSLAASIAKEEPSPAEAADQHAEAVLLEARQAAAEQAQKILTQAEQEAEQILSDAKAEAGRIYRAAGAMCDEVTAFRDTLFGLYNNHIESVEQLASLTIRCLDNVDAIRDASQSADAETEEMDDIDLFSSPAPLEEKEEEAEEEIPSPTEPEKAEEADSEWPAEVPEAAETEPADAPDEVAEMPVYEEPEADPVKIAAGTYATLLGKDLYVDPADEEDETESDESVGTFPSDPYGYMVGDGQDYADEDDDDDDDDDEEEEDEETTAPPFGTADLIEEELPEEEEDEEDEDFDPAPDADTEDTRILDIGALLRQREQEDARRTPTEADDFNESFMRDFEVAPAAEAFDDLDALFSSDLNGRNLSVTDEFDIVFANSDSKKNVDEIRRQPIIPPEEPKKPKKHSKF